HSLLAQSVRLAMDKAEAGAGEEQQLPPAGIAMQVLQHLARVGAGQPLGFGHALLLAEQQVDDPATAHVLAWPAAVSEDVGVVTAGVLQGVSEDGQAVEGALVVDELGEVANRAVIPGEPGEVEGHGAKSQGAEDVVEQLPL